MVVLKCVAGVFEGIVEGVKSCEKEEIVSILLCLHSPAEDGNYKSYWRLQYTDEEDEVKFFGPRIAVEFIVKKKTESKFILNIMIIIF